MAVSKNGRRTISVNGEQYIWSVRDDCDYAGIGSTATLQISSGDKKLLIDYPVNQSGIRNIIAIHALQVGDDTIADGICRHVECPGWEKGKAITPGIVRKIISWCLEDREHVDVNHLGNLEEAEPEPDKPKTSHLRLVVSN